MISTIFNYYEQLVFDRVRHVMATVPLDSPDQDTLEDLLCIALNLLPPRYVRHTVDLVHHLNDAERGRLQQEVEDAVDVAIETLRRRRRPRAEEEQQSTDAAAITA